MDFIVRSCKKENRDGCDANSGGDGERKEKSGCRKFWVFFFFSSVNMEAHTTERHQLRTAAGMETIRDGNGQEEDDKGTETAQSRPLNLDYFIPCAWRPSAESRERSASLPASFDSCLHSKVASK